MNLPSDVSSWIIESGCTSNMTFERSLFVTYCSQSDFNATLGIDLKVIVIGRGDVILNVRDGTASRKVKLENGFYVLDLKYSLLSAKVTDR